MTSQSNPVFSNGWMTISPWMMICLGLNTIAISTPILAQPVLAQPVPPSQSQATPIPADRPSSGADTNRPVSGAAIDPDPLPPDPLPIDPNLIDRSSSSKTREPAVQSSETSKDRTAADPPDAASFQIAQGLPASPAETVTVVDSCLADCNPTEQFNFSPPLNLAVPPRSVYQRPDIAQSPLIPVPSTPSLTDRTATVPPPPSQDFERSPQPNPSSPLIVPPAQPSGAAVAQSPVSPPATPASPLIVPPAQPSGAATAQTPVQSAEALGRRAITPPALQFQGAYIYQGGEDSARIRVTGVYPILPELQVGASIDFTDGDVFSESGDDGLSINELYVAAAVPDYPNLRLIVGQIDLTSYFDRNSFAKDSATHFFNPVFATNPALSAAGLGSRQGAVVNWTIIDEIEVRAAAFSSDRSISDFQVNGFAGEIAARLGNLIVRGTYITSEDAGADTGFEEIFQLQRSNGEFGLRDGDQERGYGINAEYFIPEINLGLFARYGWYENDGVDRTATTYSFGINALDLFMENDRLGVGYGRLLSNDDLQDGDNPDVWEAFYDFQLLDSLRLGFTFQGLDEFSETIAGFRIRADLDLVPRRTP